VKISMGASRERYPFPLLDSATMQDFRLVADDFPYSQIAPGASSTKHIRSSQLQTPATYLASHFFEVLTIVRSSRLPIS
jgi:hypothetical protein